MKKSGLALVGAALLLTLGFATVTVGTAAAAPSAPVTAPAAEITIAQWDRRDRYRHRARCRNTIHYGWRNRRCVRVEQTVCRNRNGGTYVTNRHVTRAPQWRCRYR
ncbi:MAG: hypothetical protein HOP13_04515 [Alphaproteobacteria bacterium]|nr:hypothetical protein [Alphaproteobacteria bacterium]